ncbi:uncharacterized protein BCR38DRAFT_318578, partial [Pseudomassariella vexata]
HNNMTSFADTPAHDAIKARAISEYSGRDKVDIEEVVDSQISNLVALMSRS